MSKVGAELHEYCTGLTVKYHPLQERLNQKTLNDSPEPNLIGLPEILQIGSNLIHLIGGKKVLDIGTYTGVSALAWALAVPKDGQVITMDVSMENYKKFGKSVIDDAPEIAAKIVLREQSALATLDELLNSGQAGTFDFAFIDADKANYGQYYEKCVQLVRSGGVIAVDNALWCNAVLLSDKDENTAAIDALNRRAHADERVRSMLLSTGDGLLLAFKK